MKNLAKDTLILIFAFSLILIGLILMTIREMMYP